MAAPRSLGSAAINQQGLRSRAEENAVNWVGILQRKVGDLLWYGKHHVEILRG